MVVNVPMGTLLPSLASSPASRFSTMTISPFRAVAPAAAVLAPQGLATPVRPVVSSAPVALAPAAPAYQPSYGNALPGTPAADAPIVAQSAPAASPISFNKYAQPAPSVVGTPVQTDWSQVATQPVGAQGAAAAIDANVAQAAAAASLAPAAVAAAPAATQQMTLAQAQASGGHTGAIVGGALAVIAVGVGLFFAVK